ncbi:Exosome complex component rrp4 [Saitoella coloradoensis]
MPVTFATPQPYNLFEPTHDLRHEDSDEDEDIDMLDPSAEAEGGLSFAKKIVTPGEIVTDDPQFMRGHGTYPTPSAIVASVAGTLHRTNKLLTISPLHARYTPQIGDLIIGRVREVGPKRWRVDIGARQDAVLMLSAINLPGGVQRRKNATDELQMRTFFQEGDMVSCEVQTTFADGAASVHTRSLKYGKLRNGILVNIPPSLITRSKTHHYSLPENVDVLLGVNGWIWVSKHVPPPTAGSAASEEVYSNVNEHIDIQTRSAIARVANCIQALARSGVRVDETMIVYAYEASLAWEEPGELVGLEVGESVVREAVVRARGER